MTIRPEFNNGGAIEAVAVVYSNFYSFFSGSGGFGGFVSVFRVLVHAAQQETFEQLSLKMSRKHNVAAYLDDNSLR